MHRFILAVLFSWVHFNVFSQTAGQLDFSFNTFRAFNGEILSTCIQSDGKILVAGSFTKFNNKKADHIIRLNPDGSKDESFNHHIDEFKAINSIDIYSMAIQPDGKIIVGGERSIYNTPGPTNNIFRLNTNGSIDSSFKINDKEKIGACIKIIVVQKDGKILLRGDFFSFHSNQKKGFVRLNTNGSVDDSFNADKEINGGIALLRDKIIVEKTMFENTDSSKSSLVQLNNNGLLDKTFNCNLKEPTNNIQISKQGKIIVRCNYYGGLYQINTDGSIDKKFDTSGKLRNIQDYSLLPDNKIIAFYNGARELLLIDTLGQIKDIIKTDHSLFERFSDVNIQSDNKILLTVKLDIDHYSLLRLNADGSPDILFNSLFKNRFTFVRKIIPTKDNKILVSGRFLSQKKNTNIIGICRLLANGENDSSFIEYEDKGPFSMTNFYLDSLERIVITISEIYGSNTKIIRILSNGQLDKSFKSEQAFNGYISNILVQKDGKIIVTGDFSEHSGEYRRHIARLNIDGTLDKSYDPGNFLDGKISTAVSEMDEKVILLGNFMLNNRISDRQVIVRINKDGSIDQSFKIVDSIEYDKNKDKYRFHNPRLKIKGIVRQPDGKLLIHGAFNVVNGDEKFKSIIRINENGKLDKNFVLGTNVGIKEITKVVVQSDGKILLGGKLENHKERLSSTYIIRLNSDGSIDENFHSGVSYDKITSDLNLELASDKQNNIYLGGSTMNEYDFYPVYYLLKLFGK